MRDPFAIITEISEKLARQSQEITSLRALMATKDEALSRISQATPRNTNSSSAGSMASWTQAVARTALQTVDKG